MTRITGVVILPDGTVARSARLEFRLVDRHLLGTVDGVVVPETVSVWPDLTGSIDIELMPAAYTVTAVVVNKVFRSNITVPDQPEVLFSTLLATPSIPSAKPGWFDAAVLGAFPVGAAGQLVGYGQNGKLKAISASTVGGGGVTLPSGEEGQVIGYDVSGEPVALTLTPEKVGAAAAYHTHPAEQITDVPDVLLIFENKLI